MRIEQLREAPIGDFDTIGNWDKSRSFRHATDRKLLTNPKAVEKIRRQYAGNDHIFNFYFVNLPEGNQRKVQTSEVGIVGADWLQKNMPKTFAHIASKQIDPEAINVIYTGNAGANRAMMTGWIMAHRLGHAVNATERRNVFTKRGYKFQASRYWNEAEKVMERDIKQIFRNVYNWKYPYESYFWGDKTVARFFENIGKSKAARDNNLGGRPYEFMYECFAQYIFTGAVTFRSLPKVFSVKGQSYHRTQVSDWDMEYYDTNDMEYLGNQMDEKFDAVLSSLKGTYLVM